MENKKKTKDEFINALCHFLSTEGKECLDGYGRVGYSLSRGELTIVAGLIEYFSDPKVPEAKD